MDVMYILMLPVIVASYFVGFLSSTISVAVIILLLSLFAFKFAYLECDFTLNSSTLKKEYFQDKIVWITGASSGIGESLTYELAEYNVNVKLILSARNKAKLNKIKDILSNNDKYNIKAEQIIVLPLDLSKRSVQESVTKSLYENVLKKLNAKSVDILINNAGIAHDSTLDEIEFDHIYDVYNVNLISPTILTRLVLPGMIKNNFGHIINMASITAPWCPAGFSIYATTKNGLISLSKVFQSEMAVINDNVKCTVCVCGAINTGIDQRAITKDGSIGSKAWIKYGIIKKGINKETCAKLICTAASNKLNEVWISSNVEAQLLTMYLVQQFPNSYDYFRGFITKYVNKVFTDKIKNRVNDI